MTDWGFTEILLILMVGLTVFGPDKLPEALRGGYRWYLHFSRKFQEVKTDLTDQLRQDEIVQSFQKDKEKLEALDASLRSNHLDLLNSFDNPNKP